MAFAEHVEAEVKAGRMARDAADACLARWYLDSYALVRERLETIKVLYFNRECQLYGIPYDMRPGIGQQPRDLERYQDGKQGVAAPWIWLGSGYDSWYGSYSPGAIEAIKVFLAPLCQLGHPYEWIRVADAAPGPQEKE